MAISDIKMNSSSVPTLKGKNNISRSTVVKQAFTQNASFGSSIFSSKTNIGNFVASRSTKINPAYQSGAQISSRLNSGQVMRHSSLAGLSGLSSASVKTNYTVDNSGQNWMQLGIAAGQLGLQFADKFGLFDKAPKVTSQGDQLMNGVNNLGGGNQLSGYITDVGLPSASSYGMNFATDYSSIQSYMNSDTFSPDALRKSASDLVKTAFEDINNAQATFNVLQQREAEVMSSKIDLEKDVASANKKKTNANKELGTQQGILKSAKENRAKMDEVLAKDDAKYKEACDNVTNRETEKTQKQENVSKCRTSLAQAESALTQASANVKAAERALNAIPNDANNSAARAAAQRALDSAKQAEAEAQKQKGAEEKNLKQAEGELENAEKNLEQARKAKNEMLTKFQNDKTKDQDAVKKCQEAEKQVENSQKQYDQALETSDIYNSDFEKLSNDLSNANSVTKQCAEFKDKMGTLKDNLVKATKLQKLANKKADKYEAKNGSKPAENKSNTTPTSQGAAPTPSMPDVEIKVYSDDTLSKMSLRDLDALKQKYTDNGDSDNAARIDKFIRQRDG